MKQTLNIMNVVLWCYSLFSRASFFSTSNHHKSCRLYINKPHYQRKSKVKKKKTAVTDGEKKNNNEYTQVCQRRAVNTHASNHVLPRSTYPAPKGLQCSINKTLQTTKHLFSNCVGVMRESSLSPSSSSSSPTSLTSPQESSSPSVSHSRRTSGRNPDDNDKALLLKAKDTQESQRPTLHRHT